MTDPIIPTADLAEAHRALDHMLEIVTPARSADSVWIMLMDSVEPLPPEQQRQNLALLLAVALQRLAQCVSQT